MRNKRGISLIVLVITIIVMIILASAIMISLSSTNIINKANEAVDKNNLQEVQILADLAWQEAQDRAESGETVVYEEVVREKLEQNGINPDRFGLIFSSDGVMVTSGWTQSGTKVVNGKLELEVGDTVNYTAPAAALTKYSYTEANDGWIVLGVENGELLLVSSNNVTTQKLTGPDGYNNGVKTLDAIGAEFLNSSVATKARSLKVADINRVSGYNPDTEGYKKAYPYETGQYMNTVQYKMNDDGTYVMYTAPDGTWVVADGTQSEENARETHTVFKKLDGTTLAAGETVTVTSTCYQYNPVTLETTYLAPARGVDPNSKAYQLLFVNETYWLADSYAYARFGRVVYGMRVWYNTNAYGASNYFTISGMPMHHTNKDEGVLKEGTFGVRAVIHLNSGVTLSEGTTYDWDIK